MPHIIDIGTMRERHLQETEIAKTVMENLFEADEPGFVPGAFPRRPERTPQEDEQIAREQNQDLDLT